MAFDPDAFIAEDSGATQTETKPVIAPIVDDPPVAVIADKPEADSQFMRPAEQDTKPSPSDRWSAIKTQMETAKTVTFAADNKNDGPSASDIMRRANAGTATHEDMDRFQSMLQAESQEEVDVRLEEDLAASTAGPAMSLALGFGKAVAGTAAGVLDLPRMAADALNKTGLSEKTGVEFTSAEWMQELSDALQGEADQMSELQQRHVMAKLSDGETLAGVTQAASNAIGDAYGMLTAMKVLNIRPGAAGTGTKGAQAIARVKHALSFATVRALGTKGSIEDRANVATLSALYMSTPALSGFAGKAAVPVDVFLNTMISLVKKEQGFGLGGQYAEARERAKVLSEEHGVDYNTVKLMEYARVAGFDVGYSLTTKGFTERGRVVPVDRTTALSEVDTRASEAQQRLDGATTRAERNMALDELQAAQKERAAIESMPSEKIVYDDPVLNSMEAGREAHQRIQEDVDYLSENGTFRQPFSPELRQEWAKPDIRSEGAVSAGSLSDVRAKVGDGGELDVKLSAVEDKFNLGDAEVIYANDTKHPDRFGSFAVKGKKPSISLNFAAIGNDDMLAGGTLNHERVHNVLTRLSLTDHAKLEPTQRDSLVEIEALMQHAQERQQFSPVFKRASFGSHFKNTQEFIAGMKTDLYFRSYLRTLDKEGKSTLRRVWDSVKDSMGVEPQTDADKAFDRLLGIPELQREVVRARQRNEAEEARREAAGDLDLSAPEGDSTQARPVFSSDVAKFLDGEAAKRMKDPHRARFYEDAASRVRAYNGEMDAFSLPEIASMLGVKNPYKAPGHRAELIYNEIQRRRLAASAQQQRDVSALDSARGMEAQTRESTEIKGDPAAATQVFRYDDFLAQRRDKNKDKQFHANALQREYPNVPELMGMIEEFTGEQGVYESGRSIMRGRQYYLNQRTDYFDWMAKDGYIVRNADGTLADRTVFTSEKEAKDAAQSGATVERKPVVTETDLKALPESLWFEMAEYLEGRPENAPNLPEYYRQVGDSMRNLDGESLHRQRVVWNRTMKYAKTGKGSYTDQQKAAMQPLRDFFEDQVASGNRSLEEFYDMAAKFVQHPSSEVLVRDNYTPHRNKQTGTEYNPVADPDNMQLARKHIRDIDVDERAPTQKRSQASLGTREGDYNPLEMNPLVEQHRNYLRHMSMFYLDQPINDAYSKLITGVMLDGKTPANHRSSMKNPVPLVDKPTGEKLTKWFESLVSIQPERQPWEQVLAKARANHFKTTAAKFNLVAKQPFQVLTTGEGAGFRDTDWTRAKDYVFVTAEKQMDDFRRFSERSFGDESEHYMGRLQNEVLLGKKQLSTELYGESLSVDWDKAGFTQKLFMMPFSFATDNKAIDFINKMPLLGGDDAAELNTAFDRANRLGSMKGWLNKGARLVLDPVKQGKEPPSFSDIERQMKMDGFLPHARRRLANLYAKGEYKEFVFEVASDHTRQGQFVYDSKLRSLNEISPAWRQVNQYASWWRGYTMNWYRHMKNTVVPDFMSDNPRQNQVAAAKAMVAMTTAAAFQQVVYGIATGRLPDYDEETMDGEFDRYKRLAASTFDYYMPYSQTQGWLPQALGSPYDQSLLSVPATPLKIIENVSPWKTRMWDKASFDRHRQIQGPSQVVDAYVRGMEFMFSGVYATAYGIATRSIDEEKANGIISRGLQRATEQGSHFLENYVWAAWRFANALDQWYPEVAGAVGAETPQAEAGGPLRTRNANWMRMLVQEHLVKEFGEVPEWWNEYQPMEQNRNLWYHMPTHMLWGSNPPLPKGREDAPEPTFESTGRERVRQARPVRTVRTR